jgi:hypothetical protein
MPCFALGLYKNQGCNVNANKIDTKDDENYNEKQELIDDDLKDV